jgi:glycosyltransferase involved in cell wall biosynthesis
MRLAVFTNQFPSRLATFFSRDLRALIDAGVTVDVFPIYPLEAELWAYVPAILDDRVLPRDRVHHLTLAAALSPVRSRLVARMPSFAIDAMAIGRSALGHGTSAFLKSAYVAAKAWAWAHRFPPGRFDHVLAYWGNYSATAAYLYHRLTDDRIPFSMIVHARMDLYRERVYLLEKMLYADNVFLVCEYNRGYVAATYPESFAALSPKIRIHHIGLDLSDLAIDDTPRRPNTVVAVGRLERLKGFHHLLEAAHLLAGRGRPIEVELIGGGEEESHLRALAQRLGIAAQVRFRGWLHSRDVIAAMRSATILAHPPIEPDAMPTVLKEALAVGTPVVASALAGAPEILDGGRCGLLVPPADSVRLADAIERLLRDAELRTNLRQAGRAWAERVFDVQRTGRCLADTLRNTPRRGPQVDRRSVASGNGRAAIPSVPVTDR